jgi:hypothetical protein
MRQVHHAGETVQVDYTGDTVVVVDDGTARAAQIFVACMPCSGPIYAEAKAFPQWGHMPGVARSLNYANRSSLLRQLHHHYLVLLQPIVTGTCSSGRALRSS